MFAARVPLPVAEAHQRQPDPGQRRLAERDGPLQLGEGLEWPPELGVIVTVFRSSGRPSMSRSGAGVPPRFRPISVNEVGTPGVATVGKIASRWGPSLKVRRYEWSPDPP